MWLAIMVYHYGPCIDGSPSIDVVASLDWLGADAVTEDIRADYASS